MSFKRVRDARRRGRRSAACASALALVLVLAACGSTAAARESSGPSLYQRLVAGYVAYARCARAHGMPNLPDPQVDAEGNDRYPALDRQGPWRWPQSVLAGCAKVWDRVHAIRDEYDSARPQPAITAATYVKKLALARCIRRHGFPTFPDPAPTGGMPPTALPPGFAKPNLSVQALAAIRVCASR
jgi:hypothetical protein